MNTRPAILINERVVLRRPGGCSGHGLTRPPTEVRKSLRHGAPFTAPSPGILTGGSNENRLVRDLNSSSTA